MARVYAPDDVPLVTPVKMRVVPVASVVLASASVALPWGASAPLWPPLGLMMLLSWRLLRDRIWPIWIGLPLGLVDDIASGQPIGSAVALWTFALIAMDAINRRVIWRDFWLDWGLAAIALALYVIAGAWLADAGSVVDILVLTGPQIAWSIMLMPLAMRAVAWLDRWRQT